MLKDKLKKITNSGEEGDNKKKIENIVVFIIILIVTILIINSIWKEDTDTDEESGTNTKRLASDTVTETSSLNNSSNENNLKEDLELILSSISGVGEVNVFINYSESSTVEAMYNETTKESTTEETDTSGGVRTIQETDTQKEVIYSEEDGNKVPVTQKVTNPVIEGAIITAEGAGDTTIKTNIIDAVSAATGLATHKIQVFEMKK